jgi:hypothetical protein
MRHSILALLVPAIVLTLISGLVIDPRLPATWSGLPRSLVMGVVTGSWLGLCAIVARGLGWNGVRPAVERSAA